MAEIYTNRIPYFLENVLNTPAGALPKGAQWVVAFDDLKGSVWKAIQKALTYEKKQWMIDGAAEVVTSDAYQVTKGCVYCQAIDLPGESLVVNPEGNIMSNAFLRSYVGQGRNQFPVMRMTFLETNVSFVDNFLRPWVIATGTFGLLARAKGEEKNYRTNIFCYKLGTYSGKDEAPTVLMKISFYDACCVSVSNEEYNYAPVSGQTTMREAQFVYNYYNIETDQGKIFQDTTNPTIQGERFDAPPRSTNPVTAFSEVTNSVARSTTTNANRNQRTLNQIVAEARDQNAPAPQTPFDDKQQQVYNEQRGRARQLRARVDNFGRRIDRPFQRRTNSEVQRQATQANTQIAKASSGTNSFNAKTNEAVENV